MCGRWKPGKTAVPSSFDRPSLTTAGEDLAVATREGLDRIADAASGVKLRPVGAPVQTWPPEWIF
jgi:hypothetical protein